MRRLMNWMSVVVGVAALASCTKRNPYKCNADEPCPLASAPYCDIDGVYGDKFRCIPTPGGGMTLDRGSHDFGSIAIGQTSGGATFTLTNGGATATGPVTASLSGAQASSFAIAVDTCGGQALAASATCSITITFQPSTAGGSAAELAVTASPGGTARAALTGTGLAAGALAISPGTQDFGSVVTGQNSSTTSFTITNPGASPTGTLAASLTGADATQFTITSDGCTGQTLVAAGTCTLSARFNPTTMGAKVGTLMVSATPGGSASAALSGTGLMPGTLTISPPSRDYGPLPQGDTTGTPFVFTITNTGGASTGTLATALTGGGSDQFGITTNGCMGMILASQATCTIAVRFAPTSAGAKSASLTVTGTPGGSAAASLNGMGLAPAMLSIAPTTQNYGNVVTTNNSTATLTVTNSGGVVSGTPSVVLGGADMALFTVASNTCVAALAPSGTCTVTVRFAPTSTGLKAGTLTVSATPGGMAVTALSGTGIGPGALSISPTSRDLGSVLQGQMSTAFSFAVSNTGGVATSSLSTGITGSDSSHFMITSDMCTGQTLAPAATCMVSALFQPSSAGAKTASLSVTATMGGTAAATLNGTGLGPASLTITPTSATFGSVTLNTTSAATSFTIRNTGGVSSGVPSASLGGTNAGEFNISSDTCTAALAPNATCAVQVTFRPTVAGSRNASLTVAASPGGSPAASLSGTGATPGVLSISPTTRDFGSVLQNTMGPTQVFTVTNTGGSTTSAITIDVGGTQANQFNKTADGCSGMTLGAGNSCTVSVRFDPTTTGTKSASLTATAGGSTSASLSGVGLECATNAQCGGSRPVCNGASGACRACSADSECTSLICSETSGACKPTGEIVYVTSSGVDGGGCGSIGAPCRTIQTAIGLAGGARDHVFVGSGTYSGALSIASRNITVVGQGSSTTSITVPTSGITALTIQGTSNVVLESLTVRDVPVPSGCELVVGVYCGTGGTLRLNDVTIDNNATIGLQADSCPLTVSRSRITNNASTGILTNNSTLVADQSVFSNNGLGIYQNSCGGSCSISLTRNMVSNNRDGGVVAFANFSMVNNYFVRNGRATSIGGVRVSAATGEFAFNTVAGNTSMPGLGSGLQCDQALGPFPNNIVYANIGGPNSMTCSWTFSDIGGGASGTGNLNVDPMFVNAAGGNFHLAPASPVRNAGTNAGAPPIDYDGDARPSNGVVEMGADEVP